MQSSTSGSMWPLQLLFVVTVIAMIVVRAWSLLSDNGPDISIAQGLLFAAIVIGAVLFWPRLWAFMNVPTQKDVLDRLDEIKQELDKPKDSPAKLNGIETKLNAIESSVADPATGLQKLADTQKKIESDVAALSTLQAGDSKRLEGIEDVLDKTSKKVGV